MKHFTIDTENSITVHTSRKAARETGAEVFATEEQFADLIGPDNKRLVEIWNTIPGVTAVTRFANRKGATERIWKKLRSLGESDPISEEAPTPAIEEMAPEGEPVGAAPFPESKTIETAQPEAAIPEATEPAIAAPVAPHAPDVAPEAAPSTKRAARAKKAPKPATEKKTREGSKTETILGLMKQPGGTTLKAIIEATDWQAHSVRGFISGTLGKKMGLTVVSAKGENGERSYSISA